MQHYQTIQYIVQKANPQIEKIIQFERYKTIINCNDYYLIALPQNDCICLEELMESIKSQYVKISIGQAIIILNRILIHLKQLFDEQKITHGDLCTKNIYISLNHDSNKFSIIIQPLNINKIHFVNYQQLNQEQFQLNRKKDLEDIKRAILYFFSLYDNTQILKFKDQLGKQNSLGSLIEEFRQFKSQYVDMNQQTLKDEELKINYFQRSEYLNQIEKFYQTFYSQLQDNFKEFWQKQDKIISQDYLFQNEMNKIAELIFISKQQTIIGIFQHECGQMLQLIDQDDYNYYNDQNYQKGNLENIFNQMYKRQFDEIYKLISILQIILTQIDQIIQQQLQYQKQIQEKCQLELKILTKDKIAAEYFKLLALELSKNNCHVKEIFQIIEICLQQQMQEYLKYELKIQIIEFLKDLK